MYIDTDQQLNECLSQEQALAGFNPLKAIGRALGGAGRAIVGAVFPGGNLIKGVLDVAAKSPKGSGEAIAQVINQATGQAPAVPVATAAPAPTDNVRQGGLIAQPQMQPGMMEMLMASMLGKQPAAPQYMPSAGGGPTISVSAPGAAAPGQMAAPSAMPPWLIPVGLAAVAAVFLMRGGGGSAPARRR